MRELAKQASKLARKFLGSPTSLEVCHKNNFGETHRLVFNAYVSAVAAGTPEGHFAEGCTAREAVTKVLYKASIA